MFSDLMLATTSSRSRSWGSCWVSGWVSLLCSLSWSCPCSTFVSCSGFDAGSGADAGSGSGVGSGVGSGSGSGFGSDIPASGLYSCSGTGFATSRGCDSVVLPSSVANEVPGPAGAGGPMMYSWCCSARIRNRAVTRNVTTRSLRGPRKVAIMAVVRCGIGLDSVPWHGRWFEKSS